jgi:hypothetical protein
MIELFEKQNEAMNAIASEKYSFILYGGAMGGGKTFWGLSALLIMCEIFPKSRWCVVREDMEKIRTTTIPSFKKLNPSGKLRESPYEYTHPNRSVILFKGENYDNDKELQWLKGLEVNGFLFEEINECQEMTFDLAFSRAGRWECDPRPKPIILGTCNPTNNWVKTRVFDRWKNGTLPNKWLYIPAKMTDNPMLTEDYHENVKNMPRYQYEVFVNGDWEIQLKTGGEFYKCFELDKHVGKCEYDPNIPLHISWDDNVNPYLPCGIFQIHIEEDENKKPTGKKFVRMIDEIAGEDPNNTIKAVCNEFKRRYPNHETGFAVYGDATANKEDTKLEKGYNFYRLIMEELKKYRPINRVQNSNPSVAMRGSWINTVLEKQLDGIVFTIDEKCKHTINDFVLTKENSEMGKLKEMETNPKTKVRYQKNGHFTDLTDYLFCSAFASEFIKYQKGGINSKPSFGKNQSKHNY